MIESKVYNQKNDELMLIIDRLSSGVNLSDNDAFKEISRVVVDLKKQRFQG
ncbi:hypothetical protein H2663_15890 [Vibrio cholerae]|uniref:hypothetical protein n=1 Tax=Vibrio cholerae TaxID=666 RepID=UPI001C9D3BF5|nr:hypothetical protein [Vibrio fluvialis]